MSEYEDFLTPDRRLCILRLLKDINGSANDSVLHTGLNNLGHVRIPREQIRKDIRFLIDNGCVTNQWMDTVQIVHITRRGVDVAEGSTTVKGIKRPAIGV